MTIKTNIKTPITEQNSIPSTTYNIAYFPKSNWIQGVITKVDIQREALKYYC